MEPLGVAGLDRFTGNCLLSEIVVLQLQQTHTTSPALHAHNKRMVLWSSNQVLGGTAVSCAVLLQNTCLPQLLGCLAQRQQAELEDGFPQTSQTKVLLGNKSHFQR
jgi:hypothetical protein